MPKQIKTIALESELYINRTSVLLACVCAVSVLLYGIFLLEAVAHAASQTAAQRRIGQLSVQLGDLEAQYLAYSQSLTEQRASQLGFIAPKEVSTVFATAATQALSLGNR